ncbi:MAG: hypothetical protein GZ093_05585 [Rhodoferax sp.]|uniref:hypothetical protein n=1 Tax=Rhodoferax sp. TaxID=50421 RepID=UPI0013FECB4D|nr:hypothetical protein [Rhodoferax sp.]NDP38209.1 hypothetical protein [Rhodoferax sp.]
MNLLFDSLLTNPKQHLRLLVVSRFLGIQFTRPANWSEVLRGGLLSRLPEDELYQINSGACGIRRKHERRPTILF